MISEASLHVADRETPMVLPRNLDTTDTDYLQCIQYSLKTTEDTTKWPEKHA